MQKEAKDFPTMPPNSESKRIDIVQSLLIYFTHTAKMVSKVASSNFRKGFNCKLLLSELMEDWYFSMRALSNICSK